MIGTIRKHSTVLWIVVIIAVIVSFLFWNVSPSTRNGGMVGQLGTIYGQPISADDLEAAKREFAIYYFMRTGEFPDHNPNVKPIQVENGAYERILLSRKAAALGVHVNEDAKITAANELLAQMGKQSRDGRPIPMSALLQALQQEGLTVDDLQRTIAGNLELEQVEQIMGLPGSLVPPQEAGAVYDQTHQEISVQAVFFAATNYSAQIPVTPADISMFYSNYMAEYRTPPRVQINYLQFGLSNLLADAEQKLGKTNLDAQVDSAFTQHGIEAVPGAKTPADAKAKIRDYFLHQGAQQIALEKATDFNRQLFAMDPVSPENFVTLAKKLGLNARTTAPFTESEGPAEFLAPGDMTSTAFKLNADSPFATKPVSSAEAVYVYGLATQLPSAIPPLEQIHARVTEDYQYYRGIMKARAAGTNFYYTAAVEMAAGKTFAEAAVAAGHAPQALEPFSISSQSIPEAEGHVDADRFKQAAFGTTPGHLSQFVPTQEGGFVVFVKALLPVDEAIKASDMRQFLTQVRNQRANEAFTLWLRYESNREFANTQFAKDMAAASKAEPRGQ